MSDAFLPWGTDLLVGPTGDIALVSGTVYGSQRVLRRLLTNSPDYIWHTDYGAGLGKFVGNADSPPAIEGTIRSQITLESSVAQAPSPAIVISVDPAGLVFVDIEYVDSAVGAPQLLSFSLGA
jgi:hypothetical protein